MNGEFLIASSFAASQDGLLSLPEVYGALSWLGVPGVEAKDVLFLVRCVSREPHISYGVFMDLFIQESTTVDADEQMAMLQSAERPTTNSVVEQQPVVVPKGETILPAMYEAAITEERMTDEGLEREMEAQAERARKFVEQQLLETDFNWMRQTRAVGARNPRTTRTSCYYDMTRGAVGSQKGTPLWMEGCGRWAFVRHGSGHVPCLKGFAGAFVVLRVPFRKSGIATRSHPRHPMGAQHIDEGLQPCVCSCPWWQEVATTAIRGR